MMSTDDRDDLVGDVADALTLDQQVPWERCARLATGADREQIENLRVIERVLASRAAAGPASETVPATRLSGSALVRHAVHALIAIASLEVAATLLLLLPWAWGDFSRAHGEVAVFMTTKLVGLAAGAGLLLWAGRGAIIFALRLMPTTRPSAAQARRPRHRARPRAPITRAWSQPPSPGAGGGLLAGRHPRRERACVVLHHLLHVLPHIVFNHHVDQGLQP